MESSETSPAGVSVGYFTPEDIYADPEYFCDKVRGNLGIVDKSDPVRRHAIVEQNLATRCGYMAIDGHVPLRTEALGSPTFHFVMEAINRPTLITAKRGEKSDFIVSGNGGWKAFVVGAMELRAGMMVHFDPTTHWYGINSLPLADIFVKTMRLAGRDRLPRATIITVTGLPVTEIGEALELAAKLVAPDRTVFWDRRK